MNHVLQALLYFFKETDPKQPAKWDKKKLADNLQKFGASVAELEKILNFISLWIDSQKSPIMPLLEELPDYPVQSYKGTRIYSARECSRMTHKSRMFLSHMENIGMLAPELREAVLDQILQINIRNNAKADLAQTQWIIFQVLLQEPPDVRIAYLERLLFHEVIELH